MAVARERPLPLPCVGWPFRHDILSEQVDGGGSSPGRSLALQWEPSALRVRAVGNSSASQVHSAITTCLTFAAPSVPFGSCGDGLATTQLRPANDEKRHFHGWAQAREFGRRNLTKRHRLGIVVGHDAVSLFCSSRYSLTRQPRAKVKRSPQ